MDNRPATRGRNLRSLVRRRGASDGHRYQRGDRRTAAGVYKSGSLEDLARGVYELSADDVIQEWPQSGERIRGRENVKAINDNYPAMTGRHPS